MREKKIYMVSVQVLRKKNELSCGMFFTIYIFFFNLLSLQIKKIEIVIKLLQIKNRTTTAKTNDEMYLPIFKKKDRQKEENITSSLQNLNG